VAGKGSIGLSKAVVLCKAPPLEPAEVSEQDGKVQTPQLR